MRIAVAGWAVTSGRGMSNLIRFGINRSLQSIFCSSIFDYDYDTRHKIDRVLVPRRDAADPALRIAVAGWAVTSGCGMSNLIRFGINRNLQSISCSSILDNDYDARHKIDRVLVPRRDAADPALRIAVAGWAVTSGCGMSNLIRFGINRSLQSISCSSILDNDYDARQKIDRVLVPRRDAADHLPCALPSLGGP